MPVIRSALRRVVPGILSGTARRRAGGLAVLLVGMLIVPTSEARAANLPPILGAGSTWAANSMAQWIADERLRDGLVVNYAATGSPDGRSQFRNRTVDFAVSDLPYGIADDVFPDPAPDRGLSYVPVAAGGTAVMYNLRIGGLRVTQLRLSGMTVAKIFTGVITSWDDPAVASDNPGLTLPARPVVPVVRSDSSGSTAQFTSWLSTEFPQLWDVYCARAARSTPCGATASYPQVPGTLMRALAGSTAVAGFVTQLANEGAITYVENAYALQSGMPTAKLLNRAGYYVGPTPTNVGVALLGATPHPVPQSLAGELTGVYENPDPRAYPLSGYAYLIAPTGAAGAPQLPMTLEKGDTLRGFGSYALCSGQRVVSQLGLAPLPLNLVSAGLSQLALVPSASASPMDLSGCRNPTLSAVGQDVLATSAPQPAGCDRQGPAQCGTTAQGVPPPVPPDPADQTLVATVAAGTLTLTASTGAVDLGTLALDPTNTRLVNTTTAQLNPVTVTDTRAGQLGYTVSGIATDFTAGAATINAATINSANLGWTPALAGAVPASINIVAGPVVAGGDGVLAGAASTAGLKTSRVLASSSYDPGTGKGSVGTVALTAGLSLKAPTNTPPGSYRTLLVITVI